MWKFGVKCFLVLIFGILETNSGGDPFAQQPRIVLEDGHMVIRSALNRNVSLSSTGQGAVQINNVDIRKMISSDQAGGGLETVTVTALNQRMTQLLGQWRSISNLVTQVSQLEENITDIGQRMNQLVGSDQNRITNRGMRRYFAKVKTLEDKVNHLTELLSTNECSSNPCRNGGTCVDSYNGFACNCPSNWEGPHCENDVNECALYSGTAFGCQNGATCINLQGSYRCDCLTNWFGIHCTEQHDDCSTASHQELCGHGSCIDEKRVQPGQPKYRCICEPGWTTGNGSPACTQDVDECQGPMVKCSVNPRVQCINLPGTFYCGPCPAGYTGNGLWCEDINECERQNGGCSMNPFVECYNTPGSRRCGPCPTGYFGNGEQCMYQSVCSNNRGGCHPLATCIDNPAVTTTYRECRCPPGYVGNGEGLTGCVQGQGMSCANNPCQHGTCQMVGQSYHCVCQSGYFGTHCEITEDPCFSTPCQNGGTCVRAQSTFSCICNEGYSGPTCAEQRNECGGYLSGSNGTLKYPEYNHHYDHGENCAWIISVDPEKVVNITFDHFRLEPGFNCEYDFLQLNDGPNAASMIVGRFCSDQLQGETFTTTHNQIYLWFRSDRSISDTGFEITWEAVDPVCGGELNMSDYGSVRSPGYPGLYPLNRTCSWLVQVPFGKRIQFSFATLMLENHQNCSFDYLKIFDGASEMDPVIGTYCSTETPAPLITSGHKAILLFHSDASVQDHGFNIAYSAIPAIQGCGGIVTYPQGAITSPNFPNVYQDNLLCEWLIRIHPENRLKITFTDFHLELHRDCEFDYLEIYEGPSDSAPLLGRFCGTNLPPDIMSNSNQVYIRFKTDASHGRPGFKLNYRTICGGVYTELSGVLTSPYYPEPYPSNIICLYEIRLPLGYLVNLTIHNIAIEYHHDCIFDSLEVRDGNSETSGLLAVLCGNSAPKSIVSTYNYLWMKFETDGSVRNLGFNAQYEAIEIGCGGVMVDNNGQISTPRHPDSYPHFMTCRWLIRAPEGSIIRLSFSTFVLEDDRQCAYDYLLIEDMNGVPIGKYCGTTMPPIITSLDNTLLLKFVSDVSISRDGFIAEYTFHDASKFCEGTYHQESGTIRSPGYPNHYPHSAHCVWILQASKNHQITLNVRNFTTEFHTDCKYDYLEIRNGGYEMSPLIGKYCGDTIMPTIRSHSDVMRLEFRSDSSMSGPGFEIDFDSSTVGCGGTLTTGRGSIVSPNYPQPYPYNADCLWLIRVAAGSIITLSVVEMDIEEHDICLYDYLQIFDGDSENSKSLARLCNSQQYSQLIKTTGNTMLLRFRSDSSEATGGFHVVYQTLCTNILTKRRGVIESPNFPNGYPHNQNCTWMIQSPPGSNISLSFSHIYIEATDNCTLDYVEVLENRPMELHSLGKFCGDMSRPPKTIHTATNTVSVRLITDRSVSREGFRLEWTTNGCGGDIIDRPFGSITSPNYPSGYPVDTTCNWHIWYPPGSRVEFTLENMDLEGHPTCEFDFVKVYGGEDVDAPLLKTFCNSVVNKPEVVTSHGNQIFVQFRTDESVSRGGFRASFKKLENGCGGRLTGQEANFLSPNYPNPYSQEDECDWLIEVSSSNLVMLEFYEFEIPEAANCSHGYVAVYDGNNSSAPLLLKHCGGKPEGFISSTSNQMLVRLAADGANVAKGFRAHYKQGCGRRLLADTGGEIQSPNYPDGYVGFANCSWILYASDFAEKVSLTITHLTIPEYDNCTMSLLVYDGDREDSPRIGEYCGHRVPPPIVSRGSILHVLLKNNGIFRATYGLLSEHCGGSFTAASGSFASPGYPTNYDMEMECVWIIEASEGNTVHVTFQAFHLEDNEYCNSDYLEIHEDDPSGRLIGKYCGNSIPSNVTSARKLWIKFRSDDIGTAPGFLAHYELQHGRVINGSSGFIASPGYPHKFQKEDLYEWTVIAPEGMFVSLQFLEMAIMQTSSYRCYSFVQIYDGIDEEAPDLGQFCGYQIPDPVVSTTNTITIQFQSRQFFPSQFFVHWSAVNSTGVSISPGKSSDCFTEFVLNTTSSATITSPGYPEKYPNNINCTYLIRTPNTHHVQLQIDGMDIEGSMPYCQFDWLAYYYAPSTNIDSWVLNRTLCERSSNIQLTSPNNMMKLMFITDNYLNYTGFRATASAVCGGGLFGDSGVLHSSVILPNIQNLGQSETFQCEWVITVKQRRTIRITFGLFDIQSDNVCSTSHILLRNGAFSTSPILGQGRYCGQTPPVIPETSSNDVYIQLVYNPASGRVPVFDLRYEQVSMGCGGHIFLSSDIPYAEISSPNYPSPPIHDIECDWVVISPAGTRLRMDFDAEFQLGPNCYSGDEIEYLELFDGGTDSAREIHRFCGHDQPSSEMTSGNALLVRYVTAVPEPQAGFKATVKIAQCGGTISAFHSNIISPQYPQNYGSSIECEWFLKMKFGYHITLTISDFQTPPADNCSFTDFLEIREMTPDGDKGDVIRTICGTPQDLPLTIEIPGPSAYMKFKSNSAITAKGFSAAMNANREEGCGGVLEDPSGVITSPRYPNAFSALRDCFWRIFAPEGRKIKFTFEAMNLPKDENVDACTSYVMIYNATHRHVASRSADYSFRYCGNSVPDPLDSSSSVAYVNFHTTGLGAGQGFKLTYTTEEEAMCGALLTGSSGIIETPIFPVQNDTYIDCRWRIETEANKTLAMKFSVLDIPGIKANFCRNGVLYTMSGKQYLGGVCGNYTNGYTMTSPYFSTGLRLVTSLAKPFLGIRGTYNTSDCGGVLDGYNTIITSPGYPNNYPPGINCHWILKVPEGEVIRLTVEDLQLEQDCTKDYLMIRNGLYLESPVIGKFCGSHTPAPIVSSGYALAIFFYSDEFGTAPGFKLTTTEVQRGCGGLIHMFQGNFSSPNYPSRYDNNVECVWTIEYSPGYLVQIEFLGRFDIEADSTCSKDYLKIQELADDGGVKDIGNKCGSAVPDVVTSKTSKLRITFHSNDRISGDGFSLKYSAVCGGHFTNQNGYIISPNYPEQYMNQLVCKYTIGKEGDHVTLTFDDYFSIEGEQNCIYDYVQIFQRDESESNSQGSYCGTIPPAQRTLEGPVILKFVTDYFYVAHGFKVHYDILDCGGLRTEPTGVISSPPAVDGYNQRIECKWHIQVESPGVIALRFTHVEMDYSYSCWDSFVLIYDGGNTSAPSIGRICGEESMILKSTGNQLTMWFVKRNGASSTTNRFSAYYYKTYGPLQGCGGTVNITSGKISSPGSAGTYFPDLDCGWTIMANVPDQVIKLSFDNFDIEGPFNGTCSYDFVEVREDGANGPFLGRFCGATVPSSIISSASRVFVHFHSNGFENRAGFNISFNVIESPCGTSALVSSTNEQTLSSPNYPSPYPVNLRCKWNLYQNGSSAVTYRRGFIQVSIKDIDVPCDGDYLQIKLINEKRYCGPQHTEVLNVFNGADIVFFSNLINNGARGFSLTYKEASCSRNYTKEGAVITNTAYPMRYNTEERCRINITAAAGKTIALYFKRFETLRSPGCRSGYLKVYDGSSENFTSLGVYCGFSVPNPLFSTGRSLFVDIKMSRNLGLYHMTYMSTDKGRGCGGKVFGAEGAISSPLYPQAYNQTSECIWYITVPGYHTVKLNFRLFALNSTDGCDSNYMEIFDGATDSLSARIARYCGQDIPANHNSQSNQAVVKLVTDSSNDQPGFLLYFDSEAYVSDPSVSFAQRVLEPDENSGS